MDFGNLFGLCFFNVFWCLISKEYWVPVGANLGSTWSELGPSWRQVGANLVGNWVPSGVQVGFHELMRTEIEKVRFASAGLKILTLGHVKLEALFDVLKVQEGF